MFLGFFSLKNAISVIFIQYKHRGGVKVGLVQCSRQPRDSEETIAAGNNNSSQEMKISESNREGDGVGVRSGSGAQLKPGI